MGKQISDEQIALAKQYFKDGFSIPECCQMSRMSRASFNKYCSDVVKAYIAEHTEAKAQRDRVAEIMPTTSLLEYDQFVSYVEFEFDSCNNIDELKAVYEQLKSDYKSEYRFVIKLRELYESKLLVKTKPDEVAKQTQLEAEQSEFDNQSQDNKAIIRIYRDSLNIKIPLARKANEWGKSRLLEHIAYWRKASEVSHKQSTKLYSIRMCN